MKRPHVRYKPDMEPLLCTEGSRPSPVFPTKKWRLILAMSLEGNAPDTDAIYRFSLYPHGKADRRDSIRPKVLGGGEGEFGGGKTTGWRSPPPIFASYPLSHVHVHWALAVEELENLIHGDAAHLFEGFFGERADMRRKEHIRQGGEGHG